MGPVGVAVALGYGWYVGRGQGQLEQSPTYKGHKDHLVNSNLRRTAYYKRLWLPLSMSTI